MTNLDLLMYARNGMISELREMERNLAVYGIDGVDADFLGHLDCLKTNLAAIEAKMQEIHSDETLIVDILGV